MIVPKAFVGPAGFGLDNTTGAIMCRDGDISESSIAEEFPLLQGLGLTPTRGDCVSRGWSRKLATAANDGKGGAFYAKPPGRF